MTSDATWVAAAVERFEKPLVGYAQRLLNDGEGARDVVQEVFLRLCRQPRARIEKYLAAWLYTVCRRLAIDHLRTAHPGQPLSGAEISDVATLPDGLIEHDDDVARVLDCVAQLPERQREAVRLKFSHGLSYREIAAVLDLSVSHVGVVLYEAMTTLRQQLIPVPCRSEAS